MYRKSFMLIIGCLLSVFILTSCKSKINHPFAAGDFNCEKLDEGGIAVGNIRSNYSSNIVFIPEEIDGYTVKQLGYPSGLWFPGNGVLKNSGDTYDLGRMYCPNTIEKINMEYMMSTPSGFKVFYCGAILNLSAICASSSNMELYVPSEKFEEFYNEISEDKKKLLYRANVCYDYNYERENQNYYVDNYDYSSLIYYVPPAPKRSGYKFSGWYFDSECTRRWYFRKEKLPILEENQDYIETKLFAKWEEVSKEKK